MLAASLISAFVPAVIFQRFLGPSVAGLLVTLLVAAILEICSEGTSPLAFELYKQTGINPSAGCLPYILQIVILIALFNVFTQVLSQNGDTISKLNSMLYAPLKFTETSTLNTRFLYMDVRFPDVFNVSGVPFPIPGPILILAGLLQFFSAKMTQPLIKKEEKIVKDTKGGADDMAVAMQSSMIYTFPAMTILFGIKFPSGLALYWLLFSVFQMYQQFKSSGWGGLTPFAKRLGLVQSRVV